MNLKKLSIAMAAFAAVGQLLIASNAMALSQFAWPPPGTPTFGGSGAPGSAGGASWSFTAWNTAEFVELHVGTGFHGAGLDGVAHDLSFSGISGQSVTYTGTTPYTSPGGQIAAGNYVIGLTLTVTLTGYGATPWTPAGSVDNVAVLDPTIGAVADITAGSDFTLNFLVEATLPGFATIPINDVNQPGGSGGLTQTSVGTAWFGTVPEPGTGVLVGFGLVALGARRRHARR